MRDQLRAVIAEWLTAAMQAKGVTAVDLADQAKVSRPTISEILNKKTDAEDATLERLAKALNTALPRITVVQPTLAVRALAPGYGADAQQATESEAPPGLDLVEEIVHHPEQFARRMEKMAADIGVKWTIAWMDGAEKILRQNRLDYSAFFAAIRASLREDRRATGSKNA